MDQGVYLTGEGSNPSGSFIYVITLAHLIHLLGGLVALGITTVKSKLNIYSKENYLGIELISIYWHFIGFCGYIYFYFLVIRKTRINFNYGTFS